MSFLGNVGNALKKGVQDIGGVAKKAAPFVSMIPGVGPLAGAGIGALGGALEEGGGLHSALQGAVGGGAGGLLGKIPGVSGMLGKVGSVLGQGAGKVGQSIADTYMPGGKLDLGKVVSTGGAISGMIGQNKQRKSAENYNNAAIDERNKLMSQILAPSNYNLPRITPANDQARY